MKQLPTTIEATLTRSEREAPFKIAPADNDPLPKITRCALEIIESDDALSYVERAVLTGEIIETGLLAQIVRTDEAA